MKTLSMIRLLLSVVVLFAVITTRVAETEGQQNGGWNDFEDVCFDIIGDVVRDVVRGDATAEEMAALQKRVADLKSLLAVYIQQKQCPPSSNVCESFKYLILTADKIVTHLPGKDFSEQEGRDIALLRQAVYEYRSERRVQSDGEIPTSYNDPQQLQFTIGYLHRPAGMDKFQIIQNGGTMHSGDLYKILFIPRQECYVYIFQADSSDKIYGLFPLEDFKGEPVKLFNPVRAGQKYISPASNKSFMLDQQIGKEKIYFLAFRQPDQELEQLYLQVVEAQNRDDSRQMQSAQTKLVDRIHRKGPAVIVSDISKTETVSWADAKGQTYSVLRQRLEGMCDGCVNVLTFNHQ